VLALGLTYTFTTDSFLSTFNILQLLKDSAYTGLISLGMSLVIIGGGIDLSAGGIVCLCGVACARASFIPGIPGIAVILIAVLAGAACGLFNGLVVMKLHLSEFVTTLASGFVFSGLALITTFKSDGRPVPMKLTNLDFISFGYNYSGLYKITIVWIALAILMQVVLTRTRFGLYTCALGANEKSALMSGVKKDRIKISGFMACGSFCGLAAAMVVAFQTATTQTLGNMMEFQAISACVVGGIVITGGKGDALAACLGAFFMTMVTSGLLKYGLSTGAHYLMYGAVIVIMINFDAQFSRLTDGGRVKKTKKNEPPRLSGVQS
jgi:ribose/xylose/arabinose/galactoside ABC-type transport system permease subunit